MKHSRKEAELQVEIITKEHFSEIHTKSKPSTDCNHLAQSEVKRLDKSVLFTTDQKYSYLSELL